MSLGAPALIHKTTDDAPHPLGDRTFQFVVSTGALDREKDRIRADGWDTREYMRNPVVPFAHDYKSLPVARTVSLRQEGDRLVAAAQFPPKHVYPFADTVHDMVQAGFLTGASAGFMPGEFVTNSWGGRDYIKGHKLLEWSVVPIPSNPHATRVPTTRAAAYDMTVKNFLGITDSRVLRLTPHRIGLDEGRLKSFLAGTSDDAPRVAGPPPFRQRAAVHDGAVKTWMGVKSDQHPSASCPQGRACPSRAAQLTLCPAASCPLGRSGTEPSVNDKMRLDIDLDDDRDLPAIKEALREALEDQVRDMSAGLIDEVVRPLLRQHLRRTTGRLD